MTLRVISLLIFVCCVSSTVFGQQEKKKGAMEAWDKNRDGLLQDDEIPPRVRPAIKKWAVRLELDPNKPLPLKTLMGAKGGKSKSLDKKAAKDRARQKKGEDAKKKKDRNKNSKEEATVKENARKVAGFGKKPTAKERAEADSSDKEKRSNDEKKSKDEKRAERHYNMLAKSLLFQNDKNKNGKLERSEWGRLKGNPARADSNKDGVLTTSELAQHLRGYGSRERDTSRRTTFSRSNRSQTNKNGKSYRFLSPHERLPDGLPSWFIEKDENLDGQISLAEYVSEVTLAKLEKFEQFDRNSDGYIEAKEYFKSTN